MSAQGCSERKTYVLPFSANTKKAWNSFSAFNEEAPDYDLGNHLEKYFLCFKRFTSSKLMITDSWYWYRSVKFSVLSMVQCDKGKKGVPSIKCMSLLIARLPLDSK